MLGHRIGQGIAVPLRTRLLGALAGLALSAGVLINLSAAAAQEPKNIIILFADGAAPTQWDFGRYSSRILREQPFVTTDVVFRKGSLGLLSVSPSNGYITDSAAAASSMSTGHKVDFDAIAVAPDGKPLRTVMEEAKSKGKRIGLVTTASVYDATPAAFSVHAKSRQEFQSIVDQYFALEPDVLMGGGADFFLPASTAGGKRRDGQNMISAFRRKGYGIARDTAQLHDATGTRLLALFSAGDMDFEIDRDPARQPTTAEMAAVALETLSRSSPRGFVLLVENENIDTAGHANDAASLMRALWAFDDAVRVALDFQRGSPLTLLIVASDHESGGFSPTYALKQPGRFSSSNLLLPGEEQVRMLGRITASLGRASIKLWDNPSDAALDDLLARFFPGFRLDADLREAIHRRLALDRNFTHPAQNILGRMVARQTGFYWGSSGHTSEPVVVGAIGPGAALFAGYQDNTEFGRHLLRLVSGN